MDILHPNLLSKQQLIDIFRQRHISIPRLEESTRDELISLYTKYLLPLPRRGGSSSSGKPECSSQPQDVEMSDVSARSCSNTNGDSRRSGNVRNRIVYSSESPVDNVSHSMKRIRLINTGGGVTSKPPVVVKRTLEISPGKGTNAAGHCVANAAPSKRQKITWP